MFYEGIADRISKNKLKLKLFAEIHVVINESV